MESVYRISYYCKKEKARKKEEVVGIEMLKKRLELFGEKKIYAIVTKRNVC